MTSTRTSLITAALLVALVMAVPPAATAQTAQVKPYMMIVFDTSGSMAWNVTGGATNGDGTWDPWGSRWCCPGDDTDGDTLANDSRVYMCKEAMRQMVAATGDITFGLMKFPQNFDPGSGLLATHYRYNQTASGTDRLRYNGNGVCSSGTISDFLAVGISAESSNDVYMWMNQHEYLDAWIVDGSEQELRAVGTTPLAWTVGRAGDYYEGAGLFTGSSVIGSDPKRGCRPYYTIILTDGEEACGGNPVTEVANMWNIRPGVDGVCSSHSDCPGDYPTDPWGARCVGGDCVYHVESYVIGFAFSTPSTTLNNMADYGDDGILNGSKTAYNAVSEVDLSAALAEIVSDSILVEVCDDVDNNCDGVIDEGHFKYCDEQGVLGPPTSSPIYCIGPGETVCDGVDDDCDTVVDNGLLNACGTCGPVPTEICDGMDNDCDTLIDEGGVCPCPHPMPEVCNNLDDDCDTIIDNGLTRVCGSSVGECSTGVQTCVAGSWGACVGEVGPVAEICDGLDNDCNGVIDGFTEPCEMAMGVGDTGVCEYGYHACTAGSWTACIGGVGPSAEVCDGLDNDCDGTPDDGNPGGGGVCGSSTGTCTTGIWNCTGGSLVCTGSTGPVPEICNGFDDDCDGATDEGNPGGGAVCGPIGLGGIGICEEGIEQCVGGSITCVGAVWPAGSETCNGLDDDCDTVADEGNPGGGAVCGSSTGTCSTGLTECTGGVLLCVGEVGPTAEICDGLDNDCDTVPDDGNPGGGGPCGSSVGTCSPGTLNCTGGSLVCTGGTGPVPETCNGLDDDCDTVPDDGNPGGGAVCGPIGLGGIGICMEGVEQCVGGSITCVGDVWPGTEVCNGLDDDCDTVPDDGNPGGGAACGSSVGTCVAGVEECILGSILCVGEVGPTAEVCDGLDNNCDTVPDDGDPGGGASCGSSVGVCSPGTMHCVSGSLTCTGGTGPTAETCNGLDDDCDTVADEGNPGGGGLCGPTTLDGIGICEAGVENCVSGAIACEGAVWPATEVCNNVDDDCDTVPDDGDPGGGGACGSSVGECVAGVEHCIVGSIVCTGAVGPSAEICDGLDNNCDGTPDDGDPGGGAPCGLDIGECSPGVVHCVGGTLSCVGGTPAVAELCNGLDDDCDGTIDDGNPEGGAPCGPVTLDGIGICEAGVTTCITIGPGVASLDCLGAVYPGTEECNGLDDDCNTLVDDGIAGGAPCGTDVGECSPGTEQCISGAWVCVGETPPSPELCDGLDNDCDGATDEGNPEGGVMCGTDIGECEPGLTYCDTTLTPPAIVCLGEVGPTPEVCDGLDNDCNHLVDDGLPLGDACGTDEGICEEGEWVCLDGELVCAYGRGPEDEACDCLDNDCDGFIDEENPCPEGICVDCSCASPCNPSEEWPCPSGKVCMEVDGEDGYWCVGDPCEEVTCEGECERCVGGECVDPCHGVVCDAGLECVVYDDCVGRCVPVDCYVPGHECDEGERCREGECEEDPCWDVVCDVGQFCREGECFDVCGADLECPDGTVCRDGECVEDPCFGVECTAGRVCIDGECTDDPCAGVRCRPPLICIDGECVDDPCSYIDCPEGYVCVGDTCVDETTLPEPDADADSDASTERHWDDVAATGTGGCAGCTVASSRTGPSGLAALALMALAALLALVRARPRRTLPLAAALIVPLLLAGCHTTPYCIGDCVEGDGGTDTEPGDALDTGTDTDVLDTVEEDGSTPDGCTPGAEELCNGFDDDCDDLIDEDFDLSSDLNNCGECGNRCDLPHAYPACVDGVCLIDPERGCDINYLDCIEDDPSDPETLGCETYCIKTRDDDSYCDGYDNDCDCEIDEDIDLTTDVDNCGSCGVRCRFLNGIPACVSATGLPADAECVLDGCLEGFHDVDGDPANGCEYECDVCERTLGACEPGFTCCTSTGDETCNLMDDDCDGDVDEGDPGSGGHCGTDEGECVAGVEHCVGGELVCVGETGPATELCDGLDNDCDASVDEPDSGSSTLPDEGLLCGDSMGDCELGTTVCVSGSIVCRDDVGPVPEVCDGHDNDCNGLIDDGAIAGMGDPCGSSVGTCSTGVMTCVAGIAVCVGEVGPVAEICDTLDNDCDGTPDNGVPGEGVVCGDSTGECSTGTMQCISGSMVCDGEVTPVTETCNGLDDDCDGTVDDGDPGGGASCGDGTGECVPGVEHCVGGSITCVGYVGPTAEVCDGLDNNCDGTPDEGDPGGGGACGSSVGTCVEGVLTCTGGSLQCVGDTGPAPEICDTLDNDCDGTPDNGVPGAGATCGFSTGECSTGTMQCISGSMVCDGETPPAPETCNGLDDDCDGTPDEGDPGGGAACGDGTGECIEGVEHCVGGSITCVGYVGPTAEVCDGLDNDCTGTADDGPMPGIGVSCGSSVGTCVEGTMLCTGGVPTCTGETGPSTEICDTLDNDCDGTPDNGVAGTGTPCGSSVGTCVEGTIQCIGGVMDCDGETGPVAEICDGLDNDCDGTPDNGDPGGGASCGDGTGECVPGVEHCVSGSVTCVGYVGPTAEVCNGLDENCDGTPDDGDPGGGGSCGSSVGECVAGTEHCLSGAIQCTGATGPTAEVCNTRDDDCDGSTDEDFLLDWDMENCGSCGTRCVDTVGPHAIVICNMGSCQVVGCDTNWWPGPTDPACIADPMDCCTYFCVHTGSEVCDGDDNDCDTLVDTADGSLLPVANFCETLGECAGTSPSCLTRCGSTDWFCDYPPTVTLSASDCTSLDPEPGALTPSCDDLDNDCNGLVDEHWTNKGNPCEPGIGACKRYGNMVCNGAGDDLECSVTAGTPSPEACNNLDDDCDTVEDNFVYPADFATVGAVNVGGIWILQHEASRPDASSCDPGTELRDTSGVLESPACAKDGVQPWTSITWDEARLACQNLGGSWDLCTAADWQHVCETSANWAYPYGNTYSATTCNGNDLDTNCPCCSTPTFPNPLFPTTTPPDDDEILDTGTMTSCTSTWGSTHVYDMSGNVKEWTRTGIANCVDYDGDTTPETPCYEIRGGSSNMHAVGLRCDFDFFVAGPQYTYSNLGFRCCHP